MRLVFICMAGLSLVSLVACGSASVAGDSGAGGASGGTPPTGGASSGGASSGGASSGGSSSGSGGSMPIPYDQWRACVSDEDCVTVPQNTCCGCQPFGVNKEFEDAARTEFGKFNASSCPPGLGCPSFPCPPDPVPICSEGMCSWKEGCSILSETDCALDAECRPYQARLCGAQTEAFVTCSRPTECVGVPTCGVSPYAQQYMFPSCLPEGWTPCPGACE